MLIIVLSLARRVTFFNPSVVEVCLSQKAVRWLALREYREESPLSVDSQANSG